MQTDQSAKAHSGEGIGDFDDLAGRRWRIKVNVATVRHLRTAHNLDLLQILDRKSNPFAQLADDPIRLCEVLWTLIQHQADESGVSELQWLESMAGDVLTAAAYALMAATIDFFPQHRRDPLAAMLTKMRTAEQALTTKLTKLANSEAIDQAIAQELDKAEGQAMERLATALAAPGN